MKGEDHGSSSKNDPSLWKHTEKHYGDSSFDETLAICFKFGGKLPDNYSHNELVWTVRFQTALLHAQHAEVCAGMTNVILSMNICI